MINQITPKYEVNTGKKIAIVVARFNDFITEKLALGAKGKLMEFGLKEENIMIYWVPGALEIPLMASRVIKKTKPDAVIAAGAVVRGETDHYNIVINESAKGISRVSLDTSTPVLNAIITCDNIDQAIQRAGIKAGNKGAEVAQATLEILSVMKKI